MLMYLSFTRVIANINKLLSFISDLAARNCLVTSDLTVKIGDYGASIHLYKVLANIGI